MLSRLSLARSRSGWVRMPPLATASVAPSGMQHDLVRADAERGELADLAIAVGRVAHAEHAAAGLVVVLGGEEIAAIGRESAVAIEMPARGGVDPAQRDPGDRIECDRKRAGPPCEHQALVRARPEGDAVAALRQGQIEAHAPARVDAGHVMGRLGIDPAAHEQRALRAARAAGTQRQPGDQRAAAQQQLPSIERAAL